jgi:thioredoxin-dependent peroxiredoxin
MLEEGDKAPRDVEVLDAEEKPVSLMDYDGTWVVLYFYPKDDTPGCTVEAKEFEEHSSKFRRRGVTVLGVSKDSGRSHQKFSQKYGLSFPLWSDPEHRLMDAFGVWQRKTFMGREHMGTVRSTFIIDPQGVIRKVFPRVTPKEHAKEVYEALQELIA